MDWTVATEPGRGSKEVSQETHIKIQQNLKQAYTEAKRIITDEKTTTDDKVRASRLLIRGLGDNTQDQKLLISFLKPQVPDELQSAVIQQLSHDAIRAP